VVKISVFTDALMNETVKSSGRRGVGASGRRQNYAFRKLIPYKFFQATRFFQEFNLKKNLSTIFGRADKWLARVHGRMLKYYSGAAPPRLLMLIKPGCLLKNRIPMRVDNDWPENGAGFVEIDCVAHCGNATPAGSYRRSI
jgi:hypothetical protein